MRKKPPFIPPSALYIPTPKEVQAALPQGQCGEDLPVEQFIQLTDAATRHL